MNGLMKTIIFNDDITISNITLEAYSYLVNGSSAIHTIMDQYCIKTDNATNITEDPNDFSENPKYILNLLLSIITVSIRTLELIKDLPKFELLEKE